jgi:creatinine amidohydrolase/Fe(II)-dependent formamide hydrolase-like protein
MGPQTGDEIMKSKSILDARVICMLFVVSAAFSAAAQGQIYYAKELNTEQYKKLDRAKTAVFLSTGILEEHGPYLPAYTDGYITEQVIRDVAAAVVRKGWNALVFPIIPIGTDAVNEVPGIYPYPGSFVVRAYTFRAMFMDLASNIGDAGFRWIFVGNDHGAPTHNRMLEHVCAYFNEMYPGGRMTVLGGFGTGSSDPEIDKLSQDARALVSDVAWREEAGGGHADIEETGIMLFLRPNLVDPGYVNAPPNTWNMMTSDKWLGYLGSPRHSKAQYGALRMKVRSERAIKQVMGVLDGTAPKPAPIAPTDFDKIDKAHRDIIARDEAIAKKQQEWLIRKGLR